MTVRSYDYIIAGAGLSGLSLAHHLIHSSLSNKKILVVDKTLAPENDKTWSFWHQGPPPFQNLIQKSWKQIQVIFDEQKIVSSLKNYRYYSIHSGNFRKVLLAELREHPAVDLLEAPILSMKGNKAEAILETNENQYAAKYIFQSCFNPAELENDPPHYPLIQHFLGWEVATSNPVFDPSTITLMDFDSSFEEGVGFIYILPWTSKKALLEYTIFSDFLKKRMFYREKLELYLYNKFNLRPLDYAVKRTEQGQIPMQDHLYSPRYAPRIINMGTVGGLTKPSTGYTFSRIQDHIQAIVNQLEQKGKPALAPRSPFRYRAYDLWLLQIIHDHPAEATAVFRQLFSNNPVDDVFRFLSEEHSLPRELKMMSKVSYVPFFRAMWKTKKRLLELS